MARLWGESRQRHEEKYPRTWITYNYSFFSEPISNTDMHRLCIKACREILSDVPHESEPRATGGSSSFFRSYSK